MTNQNVIEMYRKEFKDVGPVTALTYDLGNGEKEIYPLVHITDTITAALYHDAKVIALRSDGKELLSLEWSEATEALLRNLKGRSALDAIVTFATNVETHDS